jgi:hypothetical protein
MICLFVAQRMTLIFGIVVASWDEYTKLRDALIASRKFQPDSHGSRSADSRGHCRNTKDSPAGTHGKRADCRRAAYPLSYSRVKAFAKGCNEYMPKPIDLSELARVVNRYLSP